MKKDKDFDYYKPPASTLKNNINFFNFSNPKKEDQNNQNKNKLS